MLLIDALPQRAVAVETAVGIFGLLRRGEAETFAELRKDGTVDCGCEASSPRSASGAGCSLIGTIWMPSLTGPHGVTPCVQGIPVLEKYQGRNSEKVQHESVHRFRGQGK